MTAGPTSRPTRSTVRRPTYDAGAYGGLLLRARAGGELRRLEGAWTTPAPRRACCVANGELKQPPPYNINSSWQTSIGFERQIGSRHRRSRSDYVYTQEPRRGMAAAERQHRVQPAHRRQLSVSRIAALLPYPEFGIVAMTRAERRAPRTMALQTRSPSV